MTPHAAELPAPQHPPPITIVIAEHPRRSIRRFNPPVKVVWITVRPGKRLRFELIHGRYQTIGRATVTFHF